MLILSSCRSESSLEQVLPVQNQEQRIMYTPTPPLELPAQLPQREAEDEQQATENIKLTHDLMLPQRGNVYHGAWLPVRQVLEPDDIEAFQQLVDYPLDSVIYYVSWGEQDWDWCEKQLQIADRQNLLLQVVWEPWLPEEENPLQSIVDGKMDEQIQAFADGAAAYGKPFFLRFAHEMNGDWYPWSGEQSGRDPALYVQTWQHIWHIFNEAGAANVVWVWSPNSFSIPAESWNDVQNYYPGKAYVDWVGIDFYGLKWNNEYPENMLDGIYALYSRSHPIMIAETAAADPTSSLPDASISKPLWIQRLFDILPLYPQVQALYWFNEDKEADWRVQSEPYPAALQAYSEGWRRLSGK